MSYVVYKKIAPVLLGLVIMTAFALPVVVAAQNTFNYIPLQPIPGAPAGGADLRGYLIAAFKIGISVAGILSVLMLVIGGFQYATSDAYSKKEEGKEKLNNVLWGLGLILVSYVLLTTVNKSLVSLNLDFGADKIIIGGKFTQGLSDNKLAYDREQARLNTLAKAAIINSSNVTRELNTTKSELDAKTEELKKAEDELDGSDRETTLTRLRQEKAQLEQTTAELTLSRHEITEIGRDQYRRALSDLTIAQNYYESGTTQVMGQNGAYTTVPKANTNYNQFIGQANAGLERSVNDLNESISAAQKLGKNDVAEELLNEREYYKKVFAVTKNILNNDMTAAQYATARTEIFAYTEKSPKAAAAYKLDRQNIETLATNKKVFEK